MEFEKIPESQLMKLIEPDKKKYAAYYTALKKHRKLVEKWEEEDQKNLYRLVEIRTFLWT